MKFRFPLIISLLFFLSNCVQLPVTKYSQFAMKIDRKVINDSLRIDIDNPIHCPLRISVSSTNVAIQEKIAKTFPVTIPSNGDTLISYWTDKTKEELPLKFTATMGNPNDSIYKKNMILPFQNDRKYKVIQGYNGKYSHTSDYSKYAIDFNLQEGDTICSAADGFVVGVIEDYSRGGKSKKWRDYANFITVFHPEMNLYTQYVHLMHKGSLVEVGDFVKSGQAIGQSGKTGHTDMEHLHFNVLKPNKSGMESVQIEFKEGYKGIEMKKGDWVKR